MTSSLDKTIDVRHYVQIPLRRKGILILATATTLCGALVGLSFVPKVYEASATLMIEERQPLARELEQIVGRATVVGSTLEAERTRLAQLVGVIQSRPFLEKVARQLKMTEDAAVRAQAAARRAQHPEVSVDDLAMRMVVQNLQARITFRTAGTGLYEIVVSDYDPEKAQLLAQWISELFVQHTRATAMDQLRAAGEFGAERLRLYEEQLRRSEAALERYKASMIQEDLARSKVRPENLALVEVLYRRVQDDAVVAEMRLGPLARTVSEAGLEASDAELRDDPEIHLLTNQLASAVTRAIDDRLAIGGEERGGSAEEGSDWPPRIAGLPDMRRDLAQRLEARARSLHPQSSAEGIRALSSYAFFRIEADVKSNVAKYLAGHIEDYKRQAQAKPVGELELERLENDVEKNRELLEMSRSQVTSSDLRQALEATSLGVKIEILNPAQLPLAPSRPNRAKILLAACLLGPMLGAVFAFLAETMDSTLRSLEEIRKLVPEPILCTMPLLEKLKHSRRGLRRHWAPAAAAGVVVLTVVFFVARVTLLQNLMVVGRSIQAIDPSVIDVREEAP